MELNRNQTRNPKSIKDRPPPRLNETFTLEEGPSFQPSAPAIPVSSLPRSVDEHSEKPISTDQSEPLKTRPHLHVSETRMGQPGSNPASTNTSNGKAPRRMNTTLVSMDSPKVTEPEKNVNVHHDKNTHSEVRDKQQEIPESVNSNLVEINSSQEIQAFVNKLPRLYGQNIVSDGRMFMDKQQNSIVFRFNMDKTRGLNKAKDSKTRSETPSDLDVDTQFQNEAGGHFEDESELTNQDSDSSESGNEADVSFFSEQDSAWTLNETYDPQQLVPFHRRKRRSSGRKTLHMSLTASEKNLPKHKKAATAIEASYKTGTDPLHSEVPPHKTSDFQSEAENSTPNNSVPKRVQRNENHTPRRTAQVPSERARNTEKELTHYTSKENPQPAQPATNVQKDNGSTPTRPSPLVTFMTMGGIQYSSAHTPTGKDSVAGSGAAEGIHDKFQSLYENITRSREKRNTFGSRVKKDATQDKSMCSFHPNIMAQQDVIHHGKGNPKISQPSSKDRGEIGTNSYTNQKVPQHSEMDAQRNINAMISPRVLYATHDSATLSAPAKIRMRKSRPAFETSSEDEKEQEEELSVEETTVYDTTIKESDQSESSMEIEENMSSPKTMTSHHSRHSIQTQDAEYTMGRHGHNTQNSHNLQAGSKVQNNHNVHDSKNTTHGQNIRDNLSNVNRNEQQMQNNMTNKGQNRKHTEEEKDKSSPMIQSTQVSRKKRIQKSIPAFQADVDDTENTSPGAALVHSHDEYSDISPARPPKSNQLKTYTDHSRPGKPHQPKSHIDQSRFSVPSRPLVENVVNMQVNSNPTNHKSRADVIRDSRSYGTVSCVAKYTGNNPELFSEAMPSPDPQMKSFPDSRRSRQNYHNKGDPQLKSLPDSRRSRQNYQAGFDRLHARQIDGVEDTESVRSTSEETLNINRETKITRKKGSEKRNDEDKMGESEDEGRRVKEKNKGRENSNPSEEQHTEKNRYSIGVVDRKKFDQHSSRDSSPIDRLSVEPPISQSSPMPRSVTSTPVKLRSPMPQINDISMIQINPNPTEQVQKGHRSLREVLKPSSMSNDAPFSGERTSAGNDMKESYREGRFTERQTQSPERQQLQNVHPFFSNKGANKPKVTVQNEKSVSNSTFTRKIDEPMYTDSSYSEGEMEGSALAEPLQSVKSRQQARQPVKPSHIFGEQRPGYTFLKRDKFGNMVDQFGNVRPDIPKLDSVVGLQWVEQLPHGSMGTGSIPTATVAPSGANTKEPPGEARVSRDRKDKGKEASRNEENSGDHDRNKITGISHGHSGMHRDEYPESDHTNTNIPQVSSHQAMEISSPENTDLNSQPVVRSKTGKHASHTTTQDRVQLQATKHNTPVSGDPERYLNFYVTQSLTDFISIKDAS